MKTLAAIAGALLGLLFLFASLYYFAIVFQIAPPPHEEPPAEGSPQAMFMAAMGGTGYLNFVKIFELIGAILVAIPKSRRAGLLVLGPIMINILATHVFIMGPATLVNPMVIGMVVLALFLVYAERRAFVAFLRGDEAAGGARAL